MTWLSYFMSSVIYHLITSKGRFRYLGGYRLRACSLKACPSTRERTESSLLSILQNSYPALAPLCWISMRRIRSWALWNLLMLFEQEPELTRPCGFADVKLALLDWNRALLSFLKLVSKPIIQYWGGHLSSPTFLINYSAPHLGLQMEWISSTLSDNNHTFLVCCGLWHEKPTFVASWPDVSSIEPA